MKDFLVLCDSRQQKDRHITKYFDDNKILWQRATLESGDYMAIRSCYEYTIDDKGSPEIKDWIYKDFSTIIDTKKDINEIAHNLCSKDHERVVNEIQKAKEFGCTNFIFLIADSKVKGINDLQNWSSERTQIKGSVLAQVMKTMRIKYDIHFIFCKKNEMGKKIIDLLKDGN